MAEAGIARAERPFWKKAGAFIAHEFRQALPPTLFFFIGFNLILLSKRLFLAEYLIQAGGFMVATMAALVVGKTVLVADKLPFLRRFDNAPLIRPILFKSVVYTALTTVARLLERLAHYLIDGGQIGGGAFVAELLGDFSWSRFIAIQIWVFALFLIYVTASEINNLLGDGELFRLFFRRRSSDLKATRRTRIRLLVRLSRLLEAHPAGSIVARESPVRQDVVEILRQLGRKE